jgi:hypothetical protein
MAYSGRGFERGIGLGLQAAKLGMDAKSRKEDRELRKQSLRQAAEDRNLAAVERQRIAEERKAQQGIENALAKKKHDHSVAMDEQAAQDRAMQAVARQIQSEQMNKSAAESLELRKSELAAKQETPAMKLVREFDEIQQMTNDHRKSIYRQGEEFEQQFGPGGAYATEAEMSRFENSITSQEEAHAKKMGLVNKFFEQRGQETVKPPQYKVTHIPAHIDQYGNPVPAHNQTSATGANLSEIYRNMPQPKPEPNDPGFDPATARFSPVTGAPVDGSWKSHFDNYEDWLKKNPKQQ